MSSGIVLSVGTGNIGGYLAKKLLDAGANITVINRSADKVKDLASRGAKVVAGAQDDAKTLDAAFAGNKSLFWLTPPFGGGPDSINWSVNAARVAAQAAKAAGITHVVVISSVGAQVGAGTGAISFHRDVEDIFKSLLPNVVILRPGFFMENILRDIPSAVAAGTAFTPTPSVYPLAVVSCSDIANKAASFLLTDNWHGHSTVGVHGPKSLNFIEGWAIISKVIGKEIKVVDITLDQFRSTMTGYGAPSFMVESYIEMFESFKTGRAFQAEPRTPDTTTSTTLKEWAEQVFKPAFNSAVAAAAAKK